MKTITTNTKHILTGLTLLFTTACTAFYASTHTEPLYDPMRPYHCFNLDSPKPQDWHCTYKGIELSEADNELMRLNIKNMRIKK